MNFISYGACSHFISLSCCKALTVKLGKSTRKAIFK